MKWMKKSIALLFCAMLAVILCLLLFGFSSTSFFCKRDFSYTQTEMLAGGVGAAVLVCICVGLALRKRPAQENLRDRVLELALWGVLLALQLVLCFHAYFLTGWDVRGILDCAYAFGGGYADVHIAYLSMYHNNVPLVMFFSVIIRALRMLMGNVGMDRCVYVLIAFQCLLNTLTGYLCSRIALRLTGCRRFSACAALVYALYIGISPWLMIPYSDSMSLLFPTAVIAVYLKQENEKRAWMKWSAIGALTGLGYMIKPQVLIVTIAIVIVEVIGMMKTKAVKKGIFQLLNTMLVIALLVGPGKSAIMKTAPVQLRPHQRMNMLHYVMMGLGTQNNGGYDWDDVVLSSTPQSMEEKRAVQIPEIKRRLQAMDAADMAEHLKKKTLTNYADGSFAWSCEGEFYREWIEDKDDVLSPFLKSIIYTEGSRYPYLLTYFHSIWLALLLGAVLKGAACVVSRKEIGNGYCVLMLSVIGITLFQLIFECRARYLYLYAPYYVLLGMSGIWETVHAGLRRTGILKA